MLKFLRKAIRSHSDNKYCMAGCMEGDMHVRIIMNTCEKKTCFTIEVSKKDIKLSEVSASNKTEALKMLTKLADVFGFRSM